MSEAVTSTPRWSVSARTSGEVLAARAQGPGVEFLLLGAPRGYALAEVEGWLRELVGVADETARTAPAEPAAGPGIPRLLHHALSGLLFYQSELWSDPEGPPPCTLALVDDGERVAFGWAGGGAVRVSVDGCALEPEWIAVRDAEGREARAFAVPATRRLELQASWSVTGAEGGGCAASATVSWPGSQPAASVPADPEPPRERFEPAPEDGATGPEGTQGHRRPRRPWRFRGWMERLAPKRARVEGRPVEEQRPIAAGTSGVAAGAGGPVPPEVESVSPVGQESGRVVTVESSRAETVEPTVTAGVESAPTASVESAAAAGVEGASPIGDHEPIAHDVVGVPDLIPPPETPAAASGSVLPEEEVLAFGFDAHEAGPFAESPAGVEPETLSEPAVDETATPAEEPVPETPAPSAARRRAAPRRAWPVEAEAAHERDAVPLWRRPWTWLALVAALFAGGWLLGSLEQPRGRGTSGGFALALRGLGLGPARYEVMVNSRPSGAWIAVDGADRAQRTPATIELEPGAHQVGISISGLGSAVYEVRGDRGDRLTLDAVLWGSIQIGAPEGTAPIAVAVDGAARGFAPLAVDSLQPGTHVVQFSGAGVPPWESAVEVRVNQATEVLAQPVSSPATGLLEVRATVSDEVSAQPLSGAAVWVDGEARGVTPLRLDLPRGPHSIRASWHGEDAPVQVLDLPGGNQRFATFEFGLAVPRPRLGALLPSPRVPLDRPTLLSAPLDGVRVAELSEMWLHVRTPEGAWRRYPMTAMKAPGGVVGAAVFPTTLFDAKGRAAFYVSASTRTGEEYFTEIQHAQAASGAAR
ncbi:MAG: PEGA domain-containing protein [Candidatus Eisenbacteria bacterium]|nr:PEGA domain-containing protein [Candidatus Eisenbacteria bacterium]